MMCNVCIKVFWSIYLNRHLHMYPGLVRLGLRPPGGLVVTDLVPAAVVVAKAAATAFLKRKRHTRKGAESIDEDSVDCTIRAMRFEVCDALALQFRVSSFDLVFEKTLADGLAVSNEGTADAKKPESRPTDIAEEPSTDQMLQRGVATLYRYAQSVRYVLKPGGYFVLVTASTPVLEAIAAGVFKQAGLEHVETATIATNGPASTLAIVMQLKPPLTSGMEATCNSSSPVSAGKCGRT